MGQKKVSIRTILAAVGAFILMLAVPSGALADNLNSQAFVLTARCNGKDLVYSWGIDGKPGGENVVPPKDTYGKSFIYPWLEADLVIRGVELLVVSHSVSINWLMVGNNAWGDIMLMLPHGQLHAINMFPKGSGFLFPRKSRMTPLSYIDLHGSCSAPWYWPWVNATVFINFYYSRADANAE